MRELTFAIATKEDIPRLITLLNYLFTQEADFTPDENKQRQALELIINNPKAAQIIVGLRNNNIIGMVNLQFMISTAEGGKAAMMEDLIVDPDHRGEGYGSQLVDYAIEFSKRKGCVRITLSTDADNYLAHSLYRTKGFVKSTMLLFRKRF